MKKLLFILMIISATSCTDSVENDKIIAERDSLQIELDALRVENDSLLKKNSEIQKNSGVDPSEVESALRNQPERIPLKAVLGGTMRFGNVKVIDNGLVLADYNDGHIEGSSIFKFEKNADSLTFEEIYTFER